MTYLLMSILASYASSSACNQALNSAEQGILHANSPGATLLSCEVAADDHESALLASWSAADAAAFADVFEDACTASLQGTPEEHIETQIIALFCVP